MKILFNEAKKLFSPILLIMIIIFAFFVCEGFMALPFWPQFHVGSPYETEVYGELIERFGPTLSRDELPGFYEFEEGLIRELEEELPKSKLFKENGIETYEGYLEAREELHTKRDTGGTLTEDEKALLEECERYTFREMPAGKLLFELQDLDRIDRDIEYGRALATDESIEYERDYLDMVGEERARLLEEKFRSEEMSLLPATPVEVIKNDVLLLTIICFAAVFSAVLLMLVTDRIRGIYPLAAASYTGKRIFKVQAVVCAGYGLLVGVLVCVIYGAALINKGAGAFLDCPIDNYYNDFWVKLSYRQYLLCMALAVVIFSGAAGLLSYIIGRLAANYISGLAAAIPAAVALGTAVYFATALFFSAQSAWVLERFWSSVALPFAITLPICAFAAAGVGLILKRDRGRDLL